MIVQTSKVSERAARFWKRLIEWYGSRVVEQYGATAPHDWCEIVNAVDNETIKRALLAIRQRHAVHPPTFPEFSAIIDKSKPAIAPAGPNVCDQLQQFVLDRHHVGTSPLSPWQIAFGWNFIIHWHEGIDGTGKLVPHHVPEYLGVVIDADGDHPGYRVMVEDMQLGN